MIAVDQTKYGIGGNCFHACLASILEIPIGEVPPEIRSHTKPELLDSFLRKHGLALVWIPEGHVTVPKGLWHLIDGRSPRGPFGHCVVGFGGRPVHDPHPSRAGLSRGPMRLGLFVSATPPLTTHRVSR